MKEVNKKIKPSFQEITRMYNFLKLQSLTFSYEKTFLTMSFCICNYIAKKICKNYLGMKMSATILQMFVEVKLITACHFSLILVKKTTSKICNYYKINLTLI